MQLTVGWISIWSMIVGVFRMVVSESLGKDGRHGFHGNNPQQTLMNHIPTVSKMASRWPFPFLVRHRCFMAAFERYGRFDLMHFVVFLPSSPMSRTESCPTVGVAVPPVWFCCLPSVVRDGVCTPEINQFQLTANQDISSSLETIQSLPNPAYICTSHVYTLPL